MGRARLVCAGPGAPLDKGTLKGRELLILIVIFPDVVSEERVVVLVQGIILVHVVYVDELLEPASLNVVLVAGLIILLQALQLLLEIFGGVPSAHG